VNTETLAVNVLVGALARRGVPTNALESVVASNRCALAIEREGAPSARVFPDLLFRVTDALFVLVEIDEVAHVFYEPACEAARLQRIAFDAPAIPPSAHLLVVRFSTAQLHGENVTLAERADAVAAAISTFIDHRALASSSSSSPSRASVLFAYYPIEARGHIDALAGKNAAGIALLPPLHCDHALAEPREITAYRECAGDDYAEARTAANEAAYIRGIETASARKKRAAEGTTPEKKKPCTIERAEANK
jgi:hypothetical protein